MRDRDIILQEIGNATRAIEEIRGTVGSCEWNGEAQPVHVRLTEIMDRLGCGTGAENLHNGVYAVLQRLDTIMKELAGYAHVLSDTHRLVGESNRRVDDAVDRLGDSLWEGRRAPVQQRLNDVFYRFDHQDRALECLSGRLDSLESGLASLAGRLGAVEGSLDEIRNNPYREMDFSSIQLAHEAAVSALSSMKDKVVSTYGEIVSARERMDLLNNEVAARLSELSRLEDQLNKREYAVTEREKEVEAGMPRKLRKERLELDQAKHEVDAAKDELKKLRKENGELRREIQCKEAKMQELNREINDLREA